MTFSQKLVALYSQYGVEKTPDEIGAILKTFRIVFGAVGLGDDDSLFAAIESSLKRAGPYPPTLPTHQQY